MIDFPVDTIHINSGSDQWGPFSFDFTRALPTGDTIASAIATSTAQDGTDSTADLIEPGSTTNTTVAVGLRLQYPGAGFIGRHELRFALTLASGAQHRFAFGYVLVSA